MALDVNITIPRSSFTLDVACSFGNGISGIFGPSGAGKSSLFYSIAGLETPAEGSINLFGRYLFDSAKKINLPPYKRNIGFVFQDKLLFPHLTVRENIRFGEKPSNSANVHFDELVNLLDISHILDEFPSHISGGETQRTAIARALFTSPELLILDEPFNAVDQTLRKNIFPYLTRITDFMNIPMLVISHDMPDIQRLTNTIYVMNKGKIWGGVSANELLFSEDSEHMFDLSNFTNSIHIEHIEAIGESLYKTKIKDSKRHIEIVSPFSPEDGNLLLLRPDEISLSAERQEHISIQNQIECSIDKIIKKKHAYYLLMNSGFNLIAEISAESFNSLDLKVGKKIFALFKSLSLKV